MVHVLADRVTQSLLFRSPLFRPQDNLKVWFLGQKKLIICFSGTARVTFNPPHQKFLLHFQYSHLKIVYTSQIVSLGRPSFAAILFVDWLVRILKLKNFSGNYSDTSFFSISLKKIKNNKPPARIIF